MVKKQFLIFALFCSPILASEKQSKKPQQERQQQRRKQPKVQALDEIMLAFENNLPYAVRFETVIISTLGKEQKLQTQQVSPLCKGGLTFSLKPNVTLASLTVHGFNHIRGFKARWKHENPTVEQLLHFIAEEVKE